MFLRFPAPFLLSYRRHRFCHGWRSMEPAKGYPLAQVGGPFSLCLLASEKSQMELLFDTCGVGNEDPKRIRRFWPSLRKAGRLSALIIALREARLPAQIHDIKAAIDSLAGSGIRFRRNGIHLWGFGRRAPGSLAGVTNGVESLEDSRRTIANNRLTSKESLASRARNLTTIRINQHRTA